MKDILNQPKDKGDYYKDKRPSEFHAVKKPDSGFAGVFGGEGGAVAAPMFRKSQHGHGSKPNKIKEVW
jgi:hypothetical protein